MFFLLINLKCCSLPRKLAKATDDLMSSPTQHAQYRNEDGYVDTLTYIPAASVPSFTTRAVTAHDDLKIDGHTSYQQSPLSRQVSHAFDSSLGVTDSASLSSKSHSHKDFSNLESYPSQRQFHFSTYKWMGKGAMLVMPSETSLWHESRFKRLPEIVVQEVVLRADNTSTQTTACKDRTENLDKSVKDVTVGTEVATNSTTVHGFLSTEFESKVHHGNETEIPGSLLLVLL